MLKTARKQELTLRERTIILLRNRPRTITLSDIATATQVTTHWLEALLRRNPIKEPSVDKIERLHKYLSDFTPEA